MGLALELLCGRASAPSTTFTGLTMSAGNSLTVRAAQPSSKVWLLQLWCDNQTAGTFRLRSPRLHDNVQGIRVDVTASDVKPLLPWGFKQQLLPQDTLIAEITGSATCGDLEQAAMLVYYEDLQGAAARLMMPDQIYSRMVNLLPIENTLALGTGGGYTGEEAITAEFDLMKANVDYALVGYTVDAECLAVRWRGADTANMGLGGPGDELGRDVTIDWFVKLSNAYRLPCIPVFNSANRAGILLDGQQDENGTDPTVTAHWVELR